MPERGSLCRSLHNAPHRGAARGWEARAEVGDPQYQAEYQHFVFSSVRIRRKASGCKGVGDTMGVTYMYVTLRAPFHLSAGLGSVGLQSPF